MAVTILLVWAGFELKHLVADYMLQTGWMIGGKANFGAPGGYAHAGVHVLASLPVLILVAGSPWVLLAALMAAEFVVHYLTDYAKARWFSSVDANARPRLFWALHGIDQTVHRLTYVGMTLVVVEFGAI